VPDEAKPRFRAQVIRYLAHLKGRHQRATVDSVLGYLDEGYPDGSGSPGPRRCRDDDDLHARSQPAGRDGEESAG
jgi:hypothetical protein